jgi:hypothetical protein
VVIPKSKQERFEGLKVAKDLLAKGRFKTLKESLTFVYGCDRKLLERARGK